MLQDEEEYIYYEIGTFQKMSRYLMYTFNAVFFIFSSMVFSICIWTKFHKDIDDYIRSISFNIYWDGVIVLMVGAMVVMAGALVGACGTYLWNMKIMCTYVIISVIGFIMNLSGATYALSIGLETSQAYPFIQESFRSLIWQYNNDIEAKRRVDNIQEYIGCCGGYSHADWDKIHMPVPNSCRNQVTGNQYRDSCAEVLSWYLEYRTGWISGIALSICFLQLFTMVFALRICRGIKERRAAYKQSYIRRIDGKNSKIQGFESFI